jgi:D-3-phosphoglycerate dehydrogenase
VHYTAPIWSGLRIQPVSLQELMAQSDAVSVQVVYASRYQGFVNDKCWPTASRARSGRHQPLPLFEPSARRGRCPTAASRPHARWRRGRVRLQGHAAARAGNLYLTPRLGSHTREARLRASWYVAHRLHETLSGPRNRCWTSCQRAMTLAVDRCAHDRSSSSASRAGDGR